MLMADRVSALEVMAGSTILVPVNPPAESQVIYVTDMSTCPVAFLVLGGRSGFFTSFAELIGITNNIENHPLSIGFTVQFPTPDFFCGQRGVGNWTVSPIDSG